MINCIILAGGNSIRMTFPKEYIEIEEKYLIHNSIEILKNVFDDIVVVSNNKWHYKDLKVRVVRDIFYKKGPMAGLHLILKLDKNFDGIVCLSEKGKILPMNGIYRNSLKENLREELIKDNRKFIRFIEDNNFKFLKYEDWKKFDEKNIFENLNTIKELEEFKKKLLTIKKD